MASVGITEKSVLVWQDVQSAVAAYGMWFAGLTCPSKKLVPVWHWLQSPALGCAGSAMAVVLPAVVGRLWKPVYWAPFVKVLGAIGYAVMPIQFMFVSWQPEQPLVTPAWICAVVGAGVANLLPGAALGALAAISPLTLARVPRWQLSHVVLDGMCELAPIGLVAGMPTMLVMPAKVLTPPAAV